MTATGPGPLRLLALSFLGLIAAGAGLLLLPVSTPPGSPIGIIDAIFTATSAVCVTGLVVRDTGTGFSMFGQVVILLLIQLGGLGIMTFSLMILGVLGRRVSFVSRSLIQQTLTSMDWKDFRPLLRTVMAFTFAMESIGATLLFARWQPELGTGKAAWCAVFHAVSAFCNAGFSLWPDSLTAWRGDPMVNVIICALIVLGGLGFVAVHEIFFNRPRQRALSVHTRLALATTVILIAGGGVMIWVLERDHTLAGMPPLDRLLASVFQSVTCRTAGFNTIDISALAPATLFLMMLLMIVGGSPGSCAGGLKTTTFAVIVLAGWNRLRHRTHVNVYYRTIPLDTVGNAIGLALTAAVLLIAGVFVLLLLESPDPVVERHGMFIGYLFETVSALGTVGLSTGVTTELLPSSRILIVALMFLGRLGPITVASSLIRENPHTDWQYPEEGVMIG